MAIEAALQRLTRPVTVLGAGGTISMRGEHAVPALDAAALVESVPALAAVPDLAAETLSALPGSHLSLTDALALARRAAELAQAGGGVVITTGTDTLEEVALLCALVYDDEAPIVLTGATRPGSAPGADGPANLVDAVAVAGAQAATGIGACVCFAGELHAATSVRKVDSTGPAAFGSPTGGPFGRIVEGRLWLHARPIRPPTIHPAQLSHRVEIITSSLGADAELLAHAARQADGLVLVAFGAGHLSPAQLAVLRSIQVPVLITTRVDRSSMLFDTYGFEAAERDLRASQAICVPFLSPAAARIALLCCLGAGLDRDQMRARLAVFDAA
jgi:L-asparaginase